MPLLQQPAAAGHHAQAVPVDRDVAGGRVRRPRERLDAHHRVPPDQPLHDGETVVDRQAADAQADQPVREVGGRRLVDRAGQRRR